MNKTEEQRVKSELCLIKNCKELLGATGLVGGGVGGVQKGRARSLPSWSSHLMGKNSHKCTHLLCTIQAVEKATIKAHITEERRRNNSGSLI